MSVDDPYSIFPLSRNVPNLSEYLKCGFGGTVFTNGELRKIEYCRRIYVGPGTNPLAEAALSAAMRGSAQIQDRIAPDPCYSYTARARRIEGVGHVFLDGFSGPAGQAIERVVMVDHPRKDIIGRSFGDAQPLTG